MVARKPAPNRRSAEQMLVELKQRLREISDLSAAGDVLNWDQATYMPAGGAGSHGRQRAMLYRLAHERAQSLCCETSRILKLRTFSDKCGHAPGKRKSAAHSSRSEPATAACGLDRNIETYYLFPIHK